ncbi:MAG TPA: FHA domain-containing protein [Candidatus Lokiarchaeia archaeon]|nr:FHA domain-containing protein [Candidatus Lokiarchaeia archaeon]
MSVICEFCGAELHVDDLKQGVCPKCGFPISEDNQKLLRDEAGLIDKPMKACVNCNTLLPEADFNSGQPCPQCGNDPTRSIDTEGPEVKQCKNCDWTIPAADYDSGKPCPNCGNDPRATPTPPGPSSEPGPSPGGNENELEIMLEVVIGSEKGKSFSLPQDKDLGRAAFEKSIQGVKPKFLEFISIKHMKFHSEEGRLQIMDLGSRNGTAVNEVQMEPNKFYEINIGSRIVLGKGAGVFRLVAYSQCPSIQPANFQLKELTTQVVYPVLLKSGEKEVFGREPLENGPIHPFLHDVFFDRLSEGDDKDTILAEFQHISRKQFVLELNTNEEGSPTLIITNLSKYGTKVNDDLLANPGDSASLIENAKISFGKTFECILEKLN